MAEFFHTEGLTYLLQVAMSEEQSAPANFYVGLAIDELVVGDGLADILNEPSGDGYARVAVASDNVDITIGASGDYIEAVFKQVEFLADGGDWGTITVVFIATTADDSGKLIASKSTSHEINDGDSYKPTCKPRLKDEA